MTELNIHTHISNDAVPALVEYCQSLEENTFTLVADSNTFAALGARVEQAMRAANLELNTIVLTDEVVTPDEEFIMQVFLAAPLGSQVFLAVGGGTITDIVRFVAYRTGNPFISVPTAPSVDGYISRGASLVIRGLKDTIFVAVPLAVFADLNTLSSAPGELIAAGFGDLLGKITALADWQLGRVIFDEKYDEAVAARVNNALQACIASADAIGARKPEAIQLLIEGLLESGTGMIEFGNSRPASGAEHHCSHYWEMKLLEDGKPAILHGAKVGYATSLIAQQYEQVRALQPNQVMDLLEGAEWMPRDETIAEIQTIYGKSADEVIKFQQRYLDLTDDDFNQIKQRIAEKWDAIQEVLTIVPPAEEVRRLMHTVGGAADWKTLGLEEYRVVEALHYAHYLRDRPTIFKLQKFMGLDPVVEI